MAALKCPNPSCPFLFDPTQVPPGAVLTCPRCTMRFTLGAPATPPAPDLAPSAPESEEPTEKLSFLQSRGMIVIGVAALMTVAAALVAVFVMGRNNDPIGNASEKTFHEINFAITTPDGWETDDATRTLARVNVIGLKKTDSSARLAVAHTSFRDRNPQPGELFEGIATDRLKVMFTDLETTRGEGTWLGQPCLKVTFRGRGIGSEGNFAGEAFGLGLNGGAYWLLAWSLESEYAAVSEELASIAKNCRLIDAKREWKPSSTGIATIASEDYSLLDGDQWWVKQADPKNEDALADLLLKAKFKAKIKTDFPPEAWAVAYVLPGNGEPMTTLKAHVKARYAKVFDIKIWKDVSDDPQGDAPNAAVPENTNAARFHAESTSTTGSKLVVLAAINTPKGIVGVEAYCPWSDRAKWEKRLIALASSLQAK